MKNLILAIIALSLSQFTFAKSKEIIDLSLNLQKANLKEQTLRIKLPLGETGSIEATENGQTNKVTVKAIKWIGNQYKINVKLKDKDEVIANSSVIVTKDQEALIQDFDSEGNSAFKVIIKAKR
jgi:hypothetical protein